MTMVESKSNRGGKRNQRNKSRQCQKWKKESFIERLEIKKLKREYTDVEGAAIRV